MGILEDISWRKQAEESLQRSEERYVLAVKGSNDGLWDYDMTANKVFYSPRYKHMLRLDLTEIDDSFDVFESRLHPSHKGRSIRFFIMSPLSFPLVVCYPMSVCAELHNHEGSEVLSPFSSIYPCPRYWC